MPLQAFHRPVSVAIHLMAVAFCITLSGCGPSRPETVSVHGRVTLDGGDWPAPGLIIFTPVEPADGFPRRAGRAFFDVRGRFDAMTYQEGDGLMPGTYRAAVYCGETVGDMTTAAASYVPAKYQNPAQSGLGVTVPVNADPIELNYDIPSATSPAAGRSADGI